MKKFHWGHGIALFYTIFALTMISAVIKSTTFDNSLVTKDYYAQDIAYQGTLDSKNNSRNLRQAVHVDRKKGNYVLVFPVDEVGHAIAGDIQLYSPVSSDRDLRWELKPDAEGKHRLPMDDVSRGRYRIIVNWTDGSKNYRDEFRIYLQS